MATFFLLNTTRVGAITKYAGALIDDAVIDTASLLAAGANLWPTNDSIVATAAARCAVMRSQGQDGYTLDEIMCAAVNASQLATTTPLIPPNAAGIYCADNVTPQTVNIAMSPLGNWKANAPGIGTGVVPNYSNGTLTIARAGVYDVAFTTSITIPNNHALYLHVMKGAQKAAMSGVTRLSASGGATVTTGGAAHGLIACVVGDVLAVHVSSDQDNTPITFLEGNFQAALVG